MIPLYRSSQDLPKDIMYFNRLQIYKELVLKEQFHFFLFELEHFQIFFGQARTFTQTFDWGAVRGNTMT